MNSRETALLVLQEIETKGIKSEQALHLMQDKAKLQRIDRALLFELVNGTLKFRLQSDFIIRHFYHHDYEKVAPVLKNILRLGVFQLLHLDRVPRSAAVNECVKLARKYKGEHLARLCNGILRKIAPDTVFLERWAASLPPAGQLSVRHSHPAWCVERWASRYGEEATESILRYNNLPPLTCFRINTLKTTPEELFTRTELAGVTRLESPLELFFFSSDFSSVEGMLHEGLVSVQNPTQGLAVLLLDPKPGESVYDMCAAPGGKATFMAQQMQNTGTIIALDRYPQKLERLRLNAEALAVTIIEPREGDALTFDPGCSPDRILLDAPCSGTGVLGRRAELRWNLTPQKLAELAALQAALLDRAATLLKPGGSLVYATCSIEPEENSAQIEAFLQRHPEFSRDLDREIFPEPLRSRIAAEGSITTLPGEAEGFDGGFAQRLTKKPL